MLNLCSMQVIIALEQYMIDRCIGKLCCIADLRIYGFLLPLNKTLSPSYLYRVFCDERYFCGNENEI